MEGFTDIRTLGAHGDGVHDDAAVINAALERGVTRLLIPDGTYLLKTTLLIPSGTEIRASENARLRLAPGAQAGRHDFLMTNDLSDGVTHDVTITGGIWDGNSMGNDRGDDLFDPTATSGAMISFRGIRRLTMRDLTLKNPLCYYLRFCEAEYVTIENVTFDSEDLHINQDGVHLAGYCRHFVMRDFYGKNGSPGDDFIALNADDCLTRQESFDMLNGPQGDILIENVHADECHCFVRLLSVESVIEDVTIRNFTGNCRGPFLNMDASRYCRVPLFRPDDEICKNGVGHLKNVLVENITVGRPALRDEEYINAETNAESLTIRNFTATTPCGRETVRIRNLAPHRLIFDNGSTRTEKQLELNEFLPVPDTSFKELTLQKM